MDTAIESKYTYIDVIIALNITDNFTASGELYVDDSTKKSKLFKSKSLNIYLKQAFI
jgi:hypothetical protein